MQTREKMLICGKYDLHKEVFGMENIFLIHIKSKIIQN